MNEPTTDLTVVQTLRDESLFVTVGIVFRLRNISMLNEVAQYRAHVLYRIHLVDSIDTVYLKEEKKPCGV
jgi:hypothetical protein